MLRLDEARATQRAAEGLERALDEVEAKVAYYEQFETHFQSEAEQCEVEKIAHHA